MLGTAGHGHDAVSGLVAKSTSGVNGLLRPESARRRRSIFLFAGRMLTDLYSTQSRHLLAEVVASDPTSHDSVEQVRSLGPPCSRGETTTVESRNTAVNHCPTQAVQKYVAARVDCGCLSPAPRQGQACRLGLSTRNFGFVLGCCLETTHISYMCVMK